MSDLVSFYYHPEMFDDNDWQFLLDGVVDGIELLWIAKKPRVNTCAEFMSTFFNSLPPPFPWSGLLLVLFQRSRPQPPTNMNFSVIFLVLVAAVAGKKTNHFVINFLEHDMYMYMYNMIWLSYNFPIFQEEQILLVLTAICVTKQRWSFKYSF